MRVPRQLLRERITIRDFQGSGARGPVYADARENVRASVQATSRLLTDENGRTVAVDTLIILRPEDGPVPIESVVTAEGVAYRVVRCYAMPDSRRPSQYELAVARFAGAGTAGGSGS